MLGGISTSPPFSLVSSPSPVGLSTGIRVICYQKLLELRRVDEQ